jgi:hypothetical protein
LLINLNYKKNVEKTVIARSEAILNPALDGRRDLTDRHGIRGVMRLLRFARKDRNMAFAASPKDWGTLL